MLSDIVNLLSSASSHAMAFATSIFDKTGTWPLVFSAISIVLITRFLLGPILGFTLSGASDMVRSRRSKSSNKG